jgi:hypothetical protein
MAAAKSEIEAAGGKWKTLKAYTVGIQQFMVFIAYHDALKPEPVVVDPLPDKPVNPPPPPIPPEAA